MNSESKQDAGKVLTQEWVDERLRGRVFRGKMLDCYPELREMVKRHYGLN